eukprot:363429-Chlamydomonas_euryale.AAC.32
MASCRDTSDARITRGVGLRGWRVAGVGSRMWGCGSRGVELRVPTPGITCRSERGRCNDERRAAARRCKLDVKPVAHRRRASRCLHALRKLICPRKLQSNNNCNGWMDRQWIDRQWIDRQTDALVNQSTDFDRLDRAGLGGRGREAREGKGGGVWGNGGWCHRGTLAAPPASALPPR